MFIKRMMQGPPSEAGGAALVDPRAGKDYPAMIEALTMRTWEDGTPRETSTLLVFIDGGKWKCCVNDRDVPRSAFVTADTLATLLVAVEKGLREDSLDWRMKPQESKRKGRP